MQPLPLMEDVDLVRRIGRANLVGLDVRAITSAAIHTAKVLTNWMMTELGASPMRRISWPEGHASSQPAAMLPKTTSRNAGVAAEVSKPPAATAPTARR